GERAIIKNGVELSERHRRCATRSRSQWVRRCGERELLAKTRIQRIEPNEYRVVRGRAADRHEQRLAIQVCNDSGVRLRVIVELKNGTARRGRIRCKAGRKLVTKLRRSRCELLSERHDSRGILSTVSGRIQ